MKNLTILREGGGGPEGKGPQFINFYLNYYWLTYENIVFQILTIDEELTFLEGGWREGPPGS